MKFPKAILIRTKPVQDHRRLGNTELQHRQQHRRHGRKNRTDGRDVIQQECEHSPQQWKIQPHPPGHQARQQAGGETDDGLDAEIAPEVGNEFSRSLQGLGAVSKRGLHLGTDGRGLKQDKDHRKEDQKDARQHALQAFSSVATWPMAQPGSIISPRPEMSFSVFRCWARNATTPSARISRRSW